MTDKIKEPGFYRTRIKDWPESERPREKLLDHGADTLSDAELLAIIIREGTGTVTALDLAKSLLVQYKNLNELSGRNLAEYTRLKGIGNAKAVTLAAAFEIGKRIASAGSPGKVKITSPELLASRYIPVMENLKQEEFRVISLDSANNIISENRITLGSLNASIVHPREVFKQAIIESAAGIIVLHNHPSGNCEPSMEDRSVTEKLVNAGETVGITLIDHLIIAGRQYYSFAEQDELQSSF